MRQVRNRVKTGGGLAYPGAPHGLDCPQPIGPRHPSGGRAGGTWRLSAVVAHSPPGPAAWSHASVDRFCDDRDGNGGSLGSGHAPQAEGPLGARGMRAHGWTVERVPTVPALQPSPATYSAILRTSPMPHWHPPDPRYTPDPRYPTPVLVTHEVIHEPRVPRGGILKPHQASFLVHPDLL